MSSTSFYLSLVCLQLRPNVLIKWIFLQMEVTTCGHRAPFNPGFPIGPGLWKYQGNNNEWVNVRKD